MAGEIVECVPNFSEGRDAGIIEAIAGAIHSVPGVAVLHRTMDVDHNRSVITFAGHPERIVEAAVRGVEKAADLIDLTKHSGVHPRVGAADVVPFVPVTGVDLLHCARLAEVAGEEIWKRLRIPVYLYEAAARTEGRRRLENVRREILTGSGSGPDIGDHQLHPSAGAVVVGARKFLIAWNVNLNTSDVSIAKSIARAIRASSGGLLHVKALGLMLASRNQAQVSMNLTDYETTSMQLVFDAILHEAKARGVEIYESEIIGLIPQAALNPTSAVDLRIRDFRPETILENRLSEILKIE